MINKRCFPEAVNFRPCSKVFTEEINNARIRIAAAEAYANTGQFEWALAELTVAEDSYRLATGAADPPPDAETMQQSIADELARVRVKVESRKANTKGR